MQNDKSIMLNVQADKLQCAAHKMTNFFNNFSSEVGNIEKLFVASNLKYQREDLV